MFGTFNEAIAIIKRIQDKYILRMRDADDDAVFIGECLAKIHVLGLAIREIREANLAKMAEFEEHEACRLQSAFEVWQAE